MIRIPLSRKDSNRRNRYEKYDFIHLKDFIFYKRKYEQYEKYDFMNMNMNKKFESFRILERIINRKQYDQSVDIMFLLGSLLAKRLLPGGSL